MKERELRLYANCSLCHKPVGHTGMPLFSIVTVERVGVLFGPMRRQDGLSQILGSARIAQAMGADEEMTESLGKVTLSICESCYLRETRIAYLSEATDVLEPKPERLPQVSR